MLGKVVADLQTGVMVGANAITGTLKKVTGYTGFSGDPNEQSGNYLALHATSEVTGSTIQSSYKNRTVTLDSDGILITRISDKTKPLSFTVTAGGKSYTRTFDISGLTLQEE